MTNPIDLMAPDVRANPSPVYAAMRRSRPVVQVEPAGLWAVSRHEDVLFVLRHPESLTHGERPPEHACRVAPVVRRCGVGGLAAAVIVADFGGVCDAFYVAEPALVAGRPVFLPRSAAACWPTSLDRENVRLDCSDSSSSTPPTR